MPRSRTIPQWMRREVARRAKHRCEYCQLQEDFCPEQFEIDHILPRALEGPTTLENLCLACPLCNGAKRSRILAEDPVTGRRVPVFSPRAQKWIQHFRWSEDFGRISGRTPVGRATVAALQMNRPRVVQLRLLWAAMGLHPPRG